MAVRCCKKLAFGTSSTSGTSKGRDLVAMASPSIDQPSRPCVAKPRGPWQAWVGAVLTGVVTLVYFLATADLLGEAWTVAAAASSLVFASVCALGAALSRTYRAAIVLLSLAVVPLLAWGVLSMAMGPVFLIAAGFLIAAVVKVASTARAQ